jgi:hypothetical protein
MEQNNWQGLNDLQEMLQLIKDEVRPRKFRLFACACLRQLRERTDDPHFRRLVVLSERYVEGDCDREAFRTAFRRAWPNGWERARVVALVAIDPDPQSMPFWRCLELCNEIIDLTSPGRPRYYYSPAPNRESKPLRKQQREMLREVVGEPFAPPRFDPAWRTPDVKTLAESIAKEGSFEDLPILADPLEDAGCRDGALLAHLRGPGPHALGCWALDLVRGRR